MACAIAKYAYIGIFTFTFGLFAQLRGPMFVSAEVILTGSPKKAMIGSPFELMCSFTGLQPMKGLEMLLNNKSAISILGNCLTLKELNSTLYEYNCPSKTQLKVIIKTVTMDNDGDIWRCLVFSSELYESTKFVISVYGYKEATTAFSISESANVISTITNAENRKHTTVITNSTEATFTITDKMDHVTLRTTSSTETFSKTVTDSTRSQEDKTATFIGATLGAICFALLVYSIVVTVILTRKTRSKGKTPLDQTATQSTYANVGELSNVTAVQGHASRNERVDLNECTGASVYTTLDPLTRDDTAAYGVLQTYSVQF